MTPSFVVTVLLVATALGFQPVNAATEDDGFDYFKSGMDWPGPCAEGKSQSPINIVSGKVVRGEPVPLRFEYEESSNITLFHTGHVIELKVNGGKNVMYTPEGAFTLKQLHFHSVSEHVFNGMFGPLEAHFVHLNEEGTKASVFGILFRFDKDDKDNPFLKKFFHAIPNNTVDTHVFNINLMDIILPPGRKRSFLSYYTYTGSLTTPPCSEIVTWYVRKTLARLSIKQLISVLQANQDVSGDRFDDRLPQPLAGRTITYHPVH